MSTEKKHRKILYKNYAPISWQLEFIIAGGIIFSLYKSTDYFKELFLHKFPISDFDYDQGLLFFGTYVLTRALLIGFAANVLLRSVWLAYSGISYWYPKGVAYDKLQVNNQQLHNHKTSETALTRLERLDKYANLSFAVAIIFTFVVLSSFIVMYLCQVFLAEVLGLYDWVNEASFNYIMASFILLLQLGVFDFLRKTKTGARTKFGTVRRFLYTIYYYVSGLFLYRKELLVLRTNGKTWVLLSFGAAYLLLCLLISVSQIGDFYKAGTFQVSLFDDRTTYDIEGVYHMDSALYEEHFKEGGVFYSGCIQSEIIKEGYLKLFVVHWKRHDYYLQYVLDSLNFKKQVPQFKRDSLRINFYANRSSDYNAAINQLYKVHLNKQPVDGLKWMRYQHPLSGEEGYMTYIAIDSLEAGRQTLDVKVGNRYSGSYSQNTLLSLPFWK
jgi:hypothetical protein